MGLFKLMRLFKLMGLFKLMFIFHYLYFHKFCKILIYFANFTRMSVKLTYEQFTTITATGSVVSTIDDYMIDATAGNIILTLLNTASTGLKGKIFTFRRLDTTANTVTIAAFGSNTISGLASLPLDSQHVLKLIRYDSNSWRRIAETKKTLTFATYTTTSPSIDPSIDFAIMNTTSNTVTVTLPSAASVPLGTRYIAVTTSAANAGAISPNLSDTINGTSAPVSVALNTGKTFVNISSTGWRQY